MRNHLAVVMLSVLAGAAGGLTASYAVRRAAALRRVNKQMGKNP